MTREPRVWSARAVTTVEALPYEARFNRYVAKGAANECWLWTGAINPQGYGRARVGYGVEGMRGVIAPRVAWVLYHRRELAADLSIDHLCRTPRCVNPQHLEAVNIHENRRRAKGKNGSPEVVERCVQALLLAADVGGGRAPRGGIRRVCPLCGESYGTDYLADHLRREIIAGDNFRQHRVHLPREVA